LLIIELRRAEPTIAPALGALGFAQTQASGIAPADDCFRPRSGSELMTALATKHSSGSSLICAAAHDRNRPEARDRQPEAG
jgi:hypothetical protein